MSTPASPDFPDPLLVADVGGTNARFALAHADDGRIQLDAIAELPAAAFATLGAAARQYLDGAGVQAARAVFAVASPVTADQIRFTNSPWTFSVAALRAELGLRTFDVINDFAAVGHSVAALQVDQLRAIGEAVPRIAADGRYAVLGPGTGLGVCALLRRDGESIVLETEGGHVGFAPADARELGVLQVLLRQHGRVSAERLLSGPGLMNLHAALCELDGVSEPVASPAEISARAAREPDGCCAEAIARLCAMLGGFAGDAVLAHGAWDGVYLAGGITAKLLDAIGQGGFRQRFEAKGRFAPLLARVPVAAIVHPQPGLLGAAVYGLRSVC